MALFRRRDAVEDSTTYQYAIEQGGIRALRRVLLRGGAIKFGAPSDEVKAVIQGLEDLPRLERMFGCAVNTASTWDEVLETP